MEAAGDGIRGKKWCKTMQVWISDLIRAGLFFSAHTQSIMFEHRCVLDVVELLFHSLTFPLYRIKGFQCNKPDGPDSFATNFQL